VAGKDTDFTVNGRDDDRIDRIGENPGFGGDDFKR
jgi:hypothetical protein